MASLKKSMVWVAADTGGVTVISILAMLVMARLLGPADFGAAAIAIGVVQLVNLYVEGLLHDALIQNPDAAEDGFSQAFWVSVGVGVAVLVAAVAAWAVLRDGPSGRLAGLMAGAAGALPFGGVIGVANARLRKGFDYRFVAVPSLASKLSSVAVGLALAWWGAGAWSLVLSFVGGYAVQAFALLLYSGWRPRWSASVAALRPLWAFALPYAFMHLLVGLRLQAFTALTAGLGGLAAAGYINMANRLTLTPQVLLNTALTNVGLPVLAARQADRAALTAGLHDLNKLIAISMPPIFLGLAACAELLVRVVLGPQWTASIAPIQVFAVGAAFYLARLPSALLLRAIGRVRYSLMNAIMHLTLTLGAMLVLRPTDALTASLLYVAPLALLIPLTLLVVWRETGLSAAEQVRSLAAPFASAVAMAAIVVGGQRLMGGLTDAAALASSIGLGVVAYAGLLLGLDGQARALVLTRVRGLAAAPSPPA